MTEAIRNNRNTLRCTATWRSRSWPRETLNGAASSARKAFALSRRTLTLIAFLGLVHQKRGNFAEAIRDSPGAGAGLTLRR